MKIDINKDFEEAFPNEIYSGFTLGQCLAAAIGLAMAAGAAFLAGLATGFFSGREEISELCKNSSGFVPKMTNERRTKLISGWKRAIQAALTFAQDEVQND